MAGVDDAEVDARGQAWRLRIRDDVQDVEEEERNRFPSSRGLAGGHGDGGDRRDSGQKPFSNVQEKMGSGGGLGRRKRQLGFW